MSEEMKNRNENRKIIPLRFSEDDPMDKELDALLKEELMREADELEAQINSDPDLIGVGASDDLFRKIVEELKEKGIWEEETEETEQEPEVSVQGFPREERPDLEELYAMMPEEDRRALEMGRKITRQQEELRQKKQRRRTAVNRLVKRGGMVAAVLVFVFGVGMTSEANRRLVSKVWDAVVANLGLRMTTNFVDEEKFVRSKDKVEIADFHIVSNEMGISEIDLGYLPEGMEYLHYEMDEEKLLATMFYSYQEKIFRISMIKNEEEGVFYYTADNPSELESIFTDAQKIEAKIGVINETDEIEAYVAQIEYKDCSYYLNGIISMEEMEKIIKDIYFL